MLTKDDLQAIQQIVRTEVKAEIKAEVKKEIKEGLAVGLKPIQKNILSLKKDVQKLRRDLNVTITSFDRDIIDTRRRVDRIEDHLQLPILQAN